MELFGLRVGFDRRGISEERFTQVLSDVHWDSLCAW